MLVLVASLAIVAGACGGRGDTTTTAARPATTDGPAPTTAPAPETTVAAPTTVATTTVAPVSTTGGPLAALLEGLAGTWTGQWTNTTFGSSGDIAMAMEAMGDGSIVITADLGGFVFGQADPEEERWIVNILHLTGPVTIESVTFGEVTLILSADGARLTAADVPAPDIANFQLDATFDDGPRIVATYLVGFDDGTVAEGTADLEPASS